MICTCDCPSNGPYHVDLICNTWNVCTFLLDEKIGRMLMDSPGRTHWLIGLIQI